MNYDDDISSDINREDFVNLGSFRGDQPQSPKQRDLVASSEKGNRNNRKSSSNAAIRKRSARKRNLEEYIEQELYETEEIFSKLGNLVNKI